MIILFVSESFLDRCIDAGPLHLGGNRSNHRPIMLKVKVPFVGKKENISKVSIKRPNWKTADDVDKNWFAHTLNEKLLDLPIPSSIFVMMSHVVINSILLIEILMFWIFY